MDADLRYTYVSRNYETISGRAPGKLVGRTWREMYRGYVAEERDTWEKFLDTLDAHEPFDDFEYSYDTADGRRRVLSKNGRPVFDENGTFLGYRGVGTDITRRREIADELEAAKTRAEAAAVAKSACLVSMSHEIRTPLAGILGVTTLLMDAGLTPAQQDLALKIKGAGESLITILNNVLDLSKIQAGKLDVERIDFDLKALITESLTLFEPKANEKGISLISDVAEDVPDGLHAAPTRIRQILLNLLGNAIKFTAQGSVTLRAAVQKADGDKVKIRFEIIDTGIGIPDEKQDTLFEEFSQVDISTARKYEGTGLGLAISKRLAELMGDEIGVDSTPGEGSTFWFTVTG